MITLATPREQETVTLHTEAQQAFAAQEAYRAALDGTLIFKWDALVADGTDRTIPLPVHFSWHEQPDEGEAVAASFFLLISFSADMTAPMAYITTECAFDVYNLEIGRTYYWCVQKEGRRSAVHSFRTCGATPRWLRIDAVSNVRDMGGYAIPGGKIRQGRVFRGGEFDLHMHLTADGAEAIRRLGLRTDLDMRGEAVGKIDHATTEAIGLRHVLIPSVPYSDVFDAAHRESLRQFYHVFADEQNYPIYFHCWGGADRTGTAAFILGALLGMKYEDLIDEYELTSLSIWGLRTRNYSCFQDFLRLFTALPGDTLAAKAESFLTEYAALTMEEIAVIRRMMTEPDANGDPR